MARIEGIDLPKTKRIVIGLTYIYGIGHTTSVKILSQAGVDNNKKVKELTDDEVIAIRQAITDMQIPIEGDARKVVTLNIKRLIEINCYRGVRHRKGLPVRGQRTHTNSRTRKGPKKQTIAGKKKAKK